MKACSYYKIIPELRLVIEYFGGYLSIEDVLETKRQQIKDNYDPTYNFIVDYREARNILDKNELKEYVNFVKQNKEFIGKRKSAIISNSTVSMVTTSIYAMYGRTALPMDIAIVQNLYEAMEWTEIDKSHYKLVYQLLTEYKGNCFD
jgi:P2-related tail formation protein